jgi:hypothetical protein
MPPVQTRKSDPRQAIAEQVRKNLRFDPRAQLVRELASAMRPDREPATKKKTSNRAESSKGKQR